jgi:hypothetical protein
LWVVVVFIYECGRCDATQERECTHDDNDDDRIKEEANADAFIFDFTPYQSWKSIKVVFFSKCWKCRRL